MAFPFGSLPLTWGQLRTKLLAAGCKVTPMRGKRDDGGGAQVWVLERDGVSHAVQPFDDHEHVQPSVMRSICNRLSLDPMDYGLAAPTQQPS